MLTAREAEDAFRELSNAMRLASAKLEYTRPLTDDVAEAHSRLADRVRTNDIPPGPTTFTPEQLGIVAQRTELLPPLPPVATWSGTPSARRKIRAGIRTTLLRLVGWTIFVLSITGIIVSIFGVK